MTPVQRIAASTNRQGGELSLRLGVAGATQSVVVVTRSAVDATVALVPAPRPSAIAEDGEEYLVHLSSLLGEYREGKRRGLSMADARRMLGL